MGPLLIALSLFITVIFPIIISLLGFSYYGSQDGPYYLITVLGINILTIIYIIGYEIRNHKKAKGSVFPYFIPLILIICFLLEMIVYPIGDSAITQLRNDIAIAFVGIFGGTYCARYSKFNDVMKNIEVIMLICTISLALSLPSLYLNGYGASIGGGGTHQTISYISAFAFGFSYYRVITRDERGYYIFTTKIYSIIAFFLMAVQALICLIGGGRGGVVLLIAIIVFLPLYCKHRKRTFWVLLLMVAVAVLGMSLIRHSDYGDILDFGLQRAFSYIEGGEIDMSQASERDVVYSMALKIINDSPIVGYGLFHQYDVFESITYNPYCHNLFLELLLQGGIILFFCGVFVMFIFLFKTHRILRSDSTMLLLLPMLLYPVLCLQFSGTWMGEPLLWFVVVIVFEYKFIHKRSIIA